MSSEGRSPPDYRAPKRALEKSPEDSFRKDDVLTGRDRIPSWRLAELSDAEREVFISIDENGLRASELAKYTSWSESTIRTLLSRARSKLPEHLTKQAHR